MEGFNPIFELHIHKTTEKTYNEWPPVCCYLVKCKSITVEFVIK